MTDDTCAQVACWHLTVVFVNAIPAVFRLIDFTDASVCII